MRTGRIMMLMPALIGLSCDRDYTGHSAIRSPVEGESREGDGENSDGDEEEASTTRPPRYAAPESEPFRHWATINGIAYSPDGRFLASGGKDGVLKVWDLRSQTLLGEHWFGIDEFSGYPHNIRSVAFHPKPNAVRVGSEILAVALGGVGTIHFVRVSEQGIELREEVDSGLRGVSCVRFDSTGERLAVGSYLQPNVTLWRFPALELEATLSTGAGKRVRSLAFSGDGRRLVVGGEYEKSFDANRAHGSVWNVATHERVFDLHSLTEYKRTVQGLAISPDGSTIVTVSLRHLHVWNAKNGEKVQRLELKAGVLPIAAQQVAFSPDGEVLAVADMDNVMIVNTETWQVDRSLVVPGRCLEFSPDGALLAVASQSAVTFWDRREWEQQGGATGHVKVFRDVDVDPSGRRAATASWDGTVRVWDLESGREVGRFPQRGRNDSVMGVAFVSDDVLVSGEWDGTVRRWDTRTGRQLASADVGSRVESVSAAKGHEAVICDFNAFLYRWGLEAAKPELLREIALEKAGTDCDSRRSAATIVWYDEYNDEDFIHVLHPDQANEVDSFQTSLDTILCLDTSHGGNLVAVGGRHGIVEVWDVEKGRRVSTIDIASEADPPLQLVDAIAFHPSDEYLVVAGTTGSIELRTIEGELVQSIAVSPVGTSIRDIEFAAEGRIFVTANGDGSLGVFRKVGVFRRVGD